MRSFEDFSPWDQLQRAWKEFGALFSPLWDAGRAILNALADRVFMVNRRGATYRRWGLILIGGVLWAWVAWRAHPLRFGANPLRALLEYPFRALFAREVFSDVLLGGAAFWFAFQIAAIYLDDVFELGDVSTAKRFIRQAAFASQYNTIEIRDGQVAFEHQESPIVRIGGPGRVSVYLENAALFEKIGGEPDVIGPTLQQRGDKGGSGESRKGLLARLIQGESSPSQLSPSAKNVLEGFERLRSVIDLRDQVGQLNSIPNRTRDGIKIQAENVRFVFSVYRGGSESTLQSPFPFSEKAIKDIVFDQTAKIWTKMMEVLIKRDMEDFISGRTLGEFLVAIGRPEIEREERQEDELHKTAKTMACIGPKGSSEGDDLEVDVGFEQEEESVGGEGVEDEVGERAQVERDEDVPAFISRPHITGLFYNENLPGSVRRLLSDFSVDFEERARDRGVELRWIDVGTWNTPHEVIPERQKEAWRITRDNMIRGGQATLEGLKAESHTGELIRLIQDMPLGAFYKISDEESDPYTVMKELASAYREQMRDALEWYERLGRSDDPEVERLTEVVKFLGRLIYRWP